MLKKRLNFAVAALLITVVGSVATLAIVRTAASADDAAYLGAGGSSDSEAAPTLEEAIEATDS